MILELPPGSESPPPFLPFAVQAVILGGLLSGALYGAVVHLSRGHTGFLWGPRLGGIKRWRVEWLALAMNGYFLGLFTFIMVAWRTDAGLVVGLVLFVTGVTAVYRSIDRRGRSDHSPRVVLVTMGAMTAIAWIAGGPQLGLMEAEGSHEWVMWALIWTIGAALTAIEVWRVGTAGWRAHRFRRWRRLTPAG